MGSFEMWLEELPKWPNESPGQNVCWLERPRANMAALTISTCTLSSDTTRSVISIDRSQSQASDRVR